jgi:hypothetical protein
MKSKWALLIVSASWFRSSAALAAPTIALTAPAAGFVTATAPVQIQGTWSSAVALQSMQVQAQSLTSPLTYTATTFSGAIDVSPLPAGPITLVVTATDVLNESATASVAIYRNDPPTLNVVTPDGFVATPNLRLQATCSDSDMYGCASISVEGITVNGTSIDQVVALTGGGPVGVVFTATDALGLTTSVSRRGYIPTPPGPYEIAQVPGSIRDFDGERILFSTGYSLVIRPLAGGPDTVVAPHGSATAFLTSRGAIWSGGEWRDGVMLANTASSNLIVRGNYAGWTSIGPSDTIPIPIFAYWRDIAADVTIKIADGGYETKDPDIAANGDMIFTWAPPGVGSYGIYRYRGGAVAKVSGTLCATCIAPGATDGVNVLYMRRYDPTLGSRPSSNLVLPSGEIVTLDPGAQGQFPADYGQQSYALQGGWTGFTMLTGGVPLAHTRSPCGIITRVGILNSVHSIHAIRDNGEVVFGAAGANYIVGPNGGLPSPFALTGKIIYRNGWYAIDDYRLLHDPNASPDAGVADGGSGPCIVDGGADGGILGDGGNSDASLDGGIDGGSVSEGGNTDVWVDQGTVDSPNAGMNDVVSDAYRNDSLVTDARQGDAPSDGSAILDSGRDTRGSLDADSGRGVDVRDDGVDTGPADGDSGCSVCSTSTKYGDGKLGFGLALGLASVSMFRRRGKTTHAVGPSSSSRS